MASRNRIADRVRELLVDEDLAPGDRLPPERELAARLGVSRSTLREGLRRLADLGIIEARQGSGTYLAELDLGDLFAVRLALEPLAARLAAQRRDAQDLRRLDEARAAMGAALGDPVAFAVADLRAHAAVAEASRSLPVRVLFAAVADLLRHSRWRIATRPGGREDAMAEIDRVVAAIGDGDGDGAAQAMRRHLERVSAAL